MLPLKESDAATTRRPWLQPGVRKPAARLLLLLPPACFVSEKYWWLKPILIIALIIIIKAQQDEDIFLRDNNTRGQKGKTLPDHVTAKQNEGKFGEDITLAPIFLWWEKEIVYSTRTLIKYFPVVRWGNAYFGCFSDHTGKRKRGRTVRGFFYLVHERTCL